MFVDYFKLAVNNLFHRKLRSWLTMIGIFIGIAAVVALVSLSFGLRQAIDDQFQKIGTDKIFITAKGTAFSVTETQQDLKQDDLDVIKRVNGIKEASGIMFLPAVADFHGELFFSYFNGIPEKEGRQLDITAQNINIESGRMLQPGEKYKVMLGNDIVNKGYFKKPPKAGDKITIENKTFQIVAILKKMGDPGTDNSFFVNNDLVKEITGKDNYYELFVQVNTGENVQEVAESIKRELRIHRNLDKGNEDFEVQTPEQLIASFNTILIVIEVLLIGIASISLLVGGIGIMNTMYTAVLERTSEIGVMKAIGARNSDILYLFLVESGMLGLVGGSIGVLLGMGASKLVEIIAQAAYGSLLIKAAFPWYLIVGALAFAFVVGAISGVLPAYQASQLKPVDSLRYE